MQDLGARAESCAAVADAEGTPETWNRAYPLTSAIKCGDDFRVVPMSRFDANDNSADKKSEIMFLWPRIQQAGALCITTAGADGEARYTHYGRVVGVSRAGLRLQRTMHFQLKTIRWKVLTGIATVVPCPNGDGGAA